MRKRSESSQTLSNTMAASRTARPTNNPLQWIGQGWLNFRISLIEGEEMMMERDYKEENVRRLEAFERKVKQTIEILGIAIQWVWAILGIAVPIFVWYNPMPENHSVQAIILALIFWILFALAQGLKAIAKLEG